MKLASLTLHPGVAIELPVEEGHLNDFCSPMWHDVFAAYPEYKQAVGPSAWNTREYFMGVAKALAKAGCGRTDEVLMQRAIQHLGLDGLQRIFDKYDGK